MAQPSAYDNGDHLGGGLTDILRQYKDVRDRLEALARDAKVLEDEKQSLQERISEAFQSDGLKTVNLEGLGKFTVYTTSFPRGTRFRRIRRLEKVAGYSLRRFL